MAIGFRIPLQFLILLPCIIGLAQDACATKISAERPNDSFQETYQYTSTPTDDLSSPNHRSVTMVYHQLDDRVECLSRTLEETFTEEITVTLLKGGNVISAKMERTSTTDRDILRKSLIRVDDRMVRVETMVETKKTAKERELPTNQKFAVDLSLLYQMRSFPFGKHEEWQVFMADFSGHFITVSVRDQGVERITVPAGTFECYRMEVFVGFFFLKSKIIYWLSLNPPHFLVKHEGKRGPFTDSYTTVLNSIGKIK